MVKKFTILMIVLMSMPAFGQVPVLADGSTVCPGEKGITYFVHPSQEGSLFEWFIEGGKISDYDFNPYDSLVIVDWIESSDVVKYSLSVVEHNMGCYGDTTHVDIGFKAASKIILEAGAVETDVCVGDIKSFDAGSNFIYYEWEGGDHSTKGESARYFDIAESRPMSYNVVVRALSVDYCETVDTVMVNFRPVPTVNFVSKLVSSKADNIPDEQLEIHSDVIKICESEYEISPGNFNSYVWSTGEEAAFIRMGELAKDSLVSVKVTNMFGCSTTDTILIQACDMPLKIYTAFTPNNDGVNEEWVIEGIELFPKAVVIVYDRYQNKVYETGRPYVQWDGRSRNGKLLPVDSYHYLIRLNDDENQIFKGHVTIVY